MALQIDRNLTLDIEMLEEYLDLPEDPELAFVVFEQRARQEFLDPLNAGTQATLEQSQKNSIR